MSTKSNKQDLTKVRQAFKVIVLMLPLRTRLALQDSIKEVQTHIGDATEFGADFRSVGHVRTSKHMQLLLTIRGQGSEVVNYDDVLQLLGKTKKQLEMKLYNSGGKAQYIVDDELITVERPKLDSAGKVIRPDFLRD